ncbi:hypothetical protein VX159_00300 [Dechloromonas sp. ZY10]|uniref:hypothetical protein n=1 Tax=Dechloromonas aquae TaxID=2664436 RepID=UPI0035296EA0
MKTRNYIFGFATVVICLLAHAQGSVDVTAGGVRVQVGTGSVASSAAGDLGADVEMDGVAVINGSVYIDGQKIPRGKTSYVSKKTGKAYRIQWGSDGNVAVEQK